MTDDKDDKVSRRKYLDDANRFGYMRRGRKSVCLGCGLPIGATELRFWDNELKDGPACVVCARKALASVRNDERGSIDTKAIESLTTGLGSVAKMLDMVLDKLETLDKRTLQIGHMVVNVETGFKKLASGRQGGVIPEIDMRPPAPAYPRSLADCPLPATAGDDWSSGNGRD